MSKRICRSAWLAFLPLLLLACAPIGSQPEPLVKLASSTSSILTPVAKALHRLNETTFHMSGAVPGAFPGGYSVFQGDQFSLNYPDNWQIEVQQTTGEPESTTISNQGRNLALFGVVIGLPGALPDVHAAAARALGVDGQSTPISAVPATVTLNGRTWQQSAWTISLSNEPFEIHVLSVASSNPNRQLFMAFGAYQGRSFVDNFAEYFWPMAQSARFPF
jgi:hypothetical protein